MENTAPIAFKKVTTRETHSALKPVKVNVKTSDGSVIHGSINLGFENRVSDIFVRSESPFIVLFDTTVPGERPGKVLVLNKKHIVWVEPEDSGE
jgi:hypothetical protein